MVRKIIKVSFLLAVVLSEMLIVSCKHNFPEDKLLITLVEGSTEPDTDTDTWRYNKQTSIALIDPNSPEAPQLLTGSFYSALSPEISYDGKKFLFAARKEQNDPWQIWEMNLKNLNLTQVTFSSDNSIDPAYLPGGRLVFSRSLRNDSLKSGYALFTCNSDGTDLNRITYIPHDYYKPSVLRDGRIISYSRQSFPVESDPSIMVLRPDGTKSELFYKSDDELAVISRGWESMDGRIIFIESGDKNEGNSVISINYNRPLHSRINHTSGLGGDFYYAFPLEPGKLMISYKQAGDSKFKLYEFNTEKNITERLIFGSEDKDVLEAVAVRERERPKKLPSEVDAGVKTGLLFCQDINESGIDNAGRTFAKAERIEIMGIDSSLGIINVEDDGSFYLKIVADMPFKIKTLAGNGDIINGPGSWLWLRPNERRGCSGCHEDNEMVPENRYALAVGKDPIKVPLKTDIFTEKEVELE